VLNFGNPFIINEQEQSVLEEKPEYIIDTKPQNFKKVSSVYILSFLQQNEQNKPFWMHNLVLNSQLQNHIRIADISHNKRFLTQTQEILDYLKKYPPNYLILNLSPAMLHDVVEIPYFEFMSDEKKMPVINKEPEIAKSLKVLSGNLKIDTFEIKPLDGALGFKNQIPEIKKSIQKRLQNHNSKMQLGLHQIAHICEKTGTKIYIIPFPILWHADKTDRYTQIPLNKILLENGNPSLWYAEIYQKSLNEMKSKLPKNVKWIDVYSSFPHDSRFYLDGFRLNEDGHNMFADMFLGRMQTGKIKFDVFK
jgi:hypothetical protein